MLWSVSFKSGAEKEFLRLDKPVQRRIKKFIETRLETGADPRRIGEALKGDELKRFWKYRVGDWRLVCEIRDREVVIHIIKIGNRREVYKNR